jgi:WD40 repeat protein
VFRADGKMASVDWAGNLFVWDSNTGLEVHSTAVQAGSKCNAVAATPDGKYLVVAGDKMPVRVLDWETGQAVREHPGHADTTWGVAVSPSGREFLTCGTDGLVLLRDLTTGAEVRRFEFDARQVWAVAFSADGTRIAASCGKGDSDDESNLIRVWEAATGKELARLTGHTRDVRWVAFHPDGRTLASAGFDGTVRLWDVDGGRLVRTIAAHGGYAERVFFVAGGKQLVSCGGTINSQEGSLAVWDAGTGREVRAWRGGGANGLIALAVSPSGSLFATGSRDRVVRLWRRVD